MGRPIFMLIILLVLIPLGIQGGVLLARASGREPDRAQTGASPQLTATPTLTGSVSRTFPPTGTSTSTHTPTITITPTPTWTPTSHPGPVTLIAPIDNAILPQPVSPTEWYFSWGARGGPCICTISIRGSGYGMVATVMPSHGYYYTYTRDDPIPTEALGPWYWDVSVWCPLGNNHSDTFTFWIEPADPPPTDTPSLTPTLTDTPTLTPIPTDTPTLKPIPTETPTPTVTLMLVPVYTETPTPTPTDTPTRTPTITTTRSCTFTPTGTPTTTPTPIVPDYRLYLPLLLGGLAPGP